jgi:DNA-binding NarL/FixJ family response regulator
MRARVLLGDDHTLVMEGVRRLLEPDFDVVGTAGDGRALVAAAQQLQPDIVLLDIGLPLLNGIEAARQIREVARNSKIVFLTQHSDNAYVQEAFLVGASAYVLKQAAASELKRALDEVLLGRFYFSESVVPPDISSRFDPNTNPSELFGKTLTPRQREVLQLLAEGKTSKEIGHVLGISVKTVEFHRAAIMDALGLRSTAELTRYAIEHGILS